MANTSREIYEKLRLFIKSPNSVHNVGDEREKLVPNPKANSSTDLDNYYRVGVFIALGIKVRDCIELSLPSIFWKYALSRVV